MATDRRNELQAVERLLKQGKLDAALGELQRVSDQASQDLFTLNRLGDLLARQGRRAEAIAYYQRIAEQFSQGGFGPKAVAIHKKILRLDPQNLQSIVQLGELYFRENLRGEARDYLLHAANVYIESRQFERAREILERLVAIDPKEIRHKIRLAEARAAAGESREAGEEFLALGRTLLDSDRPAEAEPLYRKAAELIPDSHLPTLGLARCLTQHGKAQAALTLLEHAVDRPCGTPAVVAELALCYDGAGRPDEALALLLRAPVLEIPLSVWKPILGGFVARGRTETLWARLGPALEGNHDPGRLAALLETLAAIETDGHPPALERLLVLQRKRGDAEGLAGTLAALAHAYESRGMGDEAKRTRLELARLRPQASAARPASEPRAQSAPAPAPARSASAPPAATRPDRPRPGELSAEVEAPPVPLNRADEEFVAGRLTQAEVLEKYGLRPQALEQIEEVTTRYPGHVGAQESRVKLLRSLGEAEPLGAALAALAIARRAEGDAVGAREAAAEAAAGNLPAPARRMLGQAGLLESPGPTGPAAAPPASAAAAVVADDVDEDGELLIDFDEGDALAPVAAAPEIVRTALGDGPPEREPAEVRREVSSAPGADLDDDPSGDADLRAIAEALESELFSAEQEPIAPEEDREQAFEEVFSTFKERVAAEVASGDYRTHYDLGIAYKEMGLADEAIREFEIAAASADLGREASAMVAVCHREGARLAEAALWYRKALASPGGEDTLCGLRYDLAEALLEAGDPQGALAEFRGLLEVDPRFRDVAGRVSELESRLDA